MGTIVSLEHEEGKRSIAVYRNGDMKAHYWLNDKDDEYRIFTIVSHLIK